VSSISSTVDHQQDLDQAVDDFWQSSAEFYQSNAVKDKLLHLQNTQAVSVNRLLFALWYSHRVQQLIPLQLIEPANLTLNAAESAVLQLRQSRQEFDKKYPKPLIGNLDRVRYHLLEAELAMEKEIQSQLISHFIGSDSEQNMVHKSKRISAEGLDFLSVENITRLCCFDLQAPNELSDDESIDNQLHDLSLKWINYLKL
jgi:uncharacterized protein (TIGR02444 family)